MVQTEVKPFKSQRKGCHQRKQLPFSDAKGWEGGSGCGRLGCRRGR